MNNIVSDATARDLFGEALVPALIMHCLERGEERARAGGRNREQVQTGLANIIIF